MSFDDQTRARSGGAPRPPGPAARAARALARRLLARIAPRYLRARAEEQELAASLGRLKAEFEHVQRRHGEQIERLEDLVRELILSLESLRRLAVPGAGADQDAVPGEGAEHDRER